jgi:hypothetical protein
MEANDAAGAEKEVVAVGVRGGADGVADAENDKVGGGWGGRGAILLSIMYLTHGDSQPRDAAATLEAGVHAPHTVRLDLGPQPELRR